MLTIHQITQRALFHWPVLSGAMHVKVLLERMKPQGSHLMWRFAARSISGSICFLVATDLLVLFLQL